MLLAQFLLLRWLTLVIVGNKKNNPRDLWFLVARGWGEGFTHVRTGTTLAPCVLLVVGLAARPQHAP
jgi:hypothetical protein